MFTKFMNISGQIIYRFPDNLIWGSDFSPHCVALWYYS